MFFTLCMLLGFVVPPKAAELDEVRAEIRAELADDFEELQVGKIGLETLGDRVAALAAPADGESAKRRVLRA